MKLSVLRALPLVVAAFFVPAVATSQDVKKSEIKSSLLMNTTPVGEVPAMGTVTIQKGGKAIIYGVRGRCGSSPPTLAIAAMDMSALPDGLGVIYDAGMGYRMSKICNGQVAVRAIGLELYPSFVGEATLIFHGTDKVVIKVANDAAEVAKKSD